jgi:16S rRNA (guanine(527)-N(7))-methyltransferase RsmG
MFKKVYDSLVKKGTPESAALWSAFQERHSLSQKQLEYFQRYYAMLLQTNEMHNLTAITDLAKVIRDHFDDSLILDRFIDCTNIKTLCDVGTGAGFPALPLKIVYPHLALVLIEVNHKKVAFLEEVIDSLRMTDVEIYPFDWRTFLRKTTYTIELFCARASLQPEELIRIFKPSSPYKESLLVYWAAHTWKPEPRVAPFVEKEEWYTLGNKRRRLVFLRNTQFRSLK